MNRWIGITGGMAAGKSTLAKKILQFYPDFIYIDVDVFRRDLFSNPFYVADLKKVILPLANVKRIDSLILNQYIYQNSEFMNAYKKILYSYLFSYCESFTNQTILIDWALLIQDRLLDYFNQVIYVSTCEEVRLKRLVNSDLSKEEILKRFELQHIPNIQNYQTENFLIIDGEDISMEEIQKFIHSMQCKFTLPKEGGKAIWEITHQCNYGCSYCIFSCNHKKTTNELTTKECFKVIDQLVLHGFFYLKITGGEPFLRKDIVEILEYASRNMITDISTNASLITADIVQKLNQIPLKMIHVSLDGNQEEHESVRGSHTYIPTIKGLNYLKKSKNKIRIGCVIHSNNENNLEEIVRDSILVGAKEIIFSIMEPMEGQDQSLMKTKSNSWLSKEIQKLQSRYQKQISVQYNFLEQPSYVYQCPGGTSFLYINPQGCISPCPWIYETHKELLSENSLRDKTLEKLLQEEKMKKFIQNKKRGVCYGEI